MTTWNDCTAHSGRRTPFRQCCTWMSTRRTSCHGRADSDRRTQEIQEETSGWQTYLPQESQRSSPVCRWLANPWKACRLSWQLCRSDGELKRGIWGELRHTTTGQYYRESLINFSRSTLNFSERVIQELCKLKKVRLKGDFYSPEFNRKFRDENATFSFDEDKSRKGHYQICVNDILLVQWFRQKANEWRNSLGIAPTRQDKGLKI